jgi:hypothetical protein
VVVSRIFTVFAAVLLVTAFALMMLPPDGMTLLDGLAEWGRDAPTDLQRSVRSTLGSFVWVKVFMPVLVRPVWMIPLFLGVLSAGLAASTLPPTESPRRTGRRL